MCLTLSPCGFAGSRSETGSSLGMFVYLLCSVFSNSRCYPSNPFLWEDVECLESAGHSSQVAFWSDSSRKQKWFAGARFGKTWRRWVCCIANCSAVWACVYWGVNAELLGIGPRTDVMMSESRETGRKEQKKKAHFRLLSSSLDNPCFQNLGTVPKSLLSRESRKQHDLWRK